MNRFKPIASEKILVLLCEFLKEIIIMPHYSRSKKVDEIYTFSHIYMKEKRKKQWMVRPLLSD